MCTYFFFGNVRGLNDSDRHQSFCNWLYLHQPIFGTILESRINEPNLNHVMTRTFPGWSYASNHAMDEDGRVILIWKSPIAVTVIHQSRE